MAGLPNALARNWPLKLTALALAAILWIVVASEETGSELVPVQIELDLPPALALSRPLPPVRALVTGPGRELIKLYAAPLVIRASVPPTAQPPSWRLPIVPPDIEVPRHAKVTIQDVEPREIPVDLDRFTRRAVPVAVRAVVEAESGYAFVGPLTVTPRVVEVSGPRSHVMALDSVRTELIEVRGVTDAFERSVSLDSAGPLVRILPRQVAIAGRVRRL